MQKDRCVVPVLSKTLRVHLKKYREKILKMGFSPRRSFIVDSCDFILEEGVVNEQNGNHE